MDEIYEILHRTLARRSKMTQPLEPMSADMRGKLMNRFKALYQAFGKNFGNLFQEVLYRNELYTRIKPPINFLEGKMNNAMKTFRSFLLHKNEHILYSMYEEIFDQAEQILLEMEVYTQRIGCSNDEEEWADWHKSLIGYCNHYNEAFPDVFRDRLYKFITPVHKRIIFEETGEDDVPVNMGDRKVDWDTMMKQIEDYKNHYFCGYLIGTLDCWLRKIPTLLGQALDEEIGDLKPQRRSSRIMDKKKKETQDACANGPVNKRKAEEEAAHTPKRGRPSKR